jgi:hypothetical protein
MPRPNLPEFEPRDITRIKSALSEHVRYLIRQQKLLEDKRGQAFKYGNMVNEEVYRKNLLAYQNTIERIKKLIPIFSTVTEEEFAFNEWE